jgi:hypothetical protein
MYSDGLMGLVPELCEWVFGNINCCIPWIGHIECITGSRYPSSCCVYRLHSWKLFEYEEILRVRSRIKLCQINSLQISTSQSQESVYRLGNPPVSC